MSTKIFFLSLTFFLITIPSFFSQIFTKDNLPPVTQIDNLREFSNANKVYKIQEYTKNESPSTSCWTERYYGHWFSFIAESNSIECVVKIEDGKGTLTSINMGLWDDNLTSIACKEPHDVEHNLSLANYELIKGNKYYVSVHPKNLSTNIGATFTFYISSKISNDFKEGAIELKNLTNWCSSDNQFSTFAGGPDYRKGSCMEKKGPNFNKWFKFKAISPQAKISIKKSGTKGTFNFAYLTLWDDQMEEISCVKHINEIEPGKINAPNLSVGKWYYISVDHPNLKTYRGSFTLCIDQNATKNETNKNQPTISGQSTISGKITSLTGDAIKKHTVWLLDNDQKVLSEQIINDKGRFSFTETDKSKLYFIELSSASTKEDVFIVQTTRNGKVVQKFTQKKLTVFKSIPLTDKHNNVFLLDFNNLKVDTDPGKHSISGKVVKKDDLIEGIKNVEMELHDKSSNNLLTTVKTDNAGNFQFDHLDGKHDQFLVKVKAPKDDQYLEVVVVNDKNKPLLSANSNNLVNGYFKYEKLPFDDAVELQLMDEEDTSLDDLDFNSTLTKGAQVTLNHINFEPGEYKLLDDSFDELNKLVVFLNKNKAVKLQISGHTDKSGIEQNNIILSEKRAKSVVDYLVSKGTSSSRLKYKGYGSSKPLLNVSPQNNSEKNRRVEITVIE